MLLALFAAMGALIAQRLELSSGLADLVPASAEQELALVSGSLVDSPLTRTMVLSVGGEDLGVAIAAARRWGARLAEHPEVYELRHGPDPDLSEAIYRLYFPHRLGFLSNRPEVELPARLSDVGLARSARELRRALASPASALAGEVGGADPWLAFPTFLEGLEPLRRGALDVVDGQFVARDGPSAILFLTTRHSAFDAAHQTPFGRFLEESFSALRSELGGGLRLERSGVHRFAAASELEARRDMQRISGLSVAGVALAFLLVFRSLWLLVVAVLPLVGGLLTGGAVALLVFGELHVMTLAFGSTLIGVCIDYPIHYVSQHALIGSLAGAGPFASLRRVWGPISMGALTTAAGFVVFAASDFPVVRQIGVFSAAGILGALLTTRILLPPLLPVRAARSPFQRRLLAYFDVVLVALRQRRTAVALLLGLAAVGAVSGLARTRWQDDLYALAQPPRPDWLEEDMRVRARVSQMDAGRFVVAFGDDVESALQRNDAVFERLAEAREAGELEDFRSLHSLLPAAALQRRNHAVLAEHSDLSRRMLAALDAEGFRTEAFGDFAESLTDPPDSPLRYEDLAGSPLAPMAAPFRVDLADRVALLTFLRGVNDSVDLGARLAGLEGVHDFEQRRFLAEIAEKHRSRASTLVGVGLLAVAVLLGARYRSGRVVAATLLPSLAAAALTLGLLGWLGIAINLLHLLGILLVLSIGVDYAIFLVGSGGGAEARAATLLGLCLACASTCLAFGLLAFSGFPALQALGLSTSIGAVLSLLLAPVALLLIDARPVAHSSD